MSPTDELVPLLKKLRLSGVLQSLERRIAQAAQDNLAPAEFLLRLLADEVERRDAKMLEQRIRWANFEHSRTLEDFDFHVNPQLPKSKLIDLATAGFVMQRRNVLLLGPSGGFQAAFIVAAALSILGLVLTRIMVPAQVKQPSAQAEQPGQPTGSGETPARRSVRGRGPRGPGGDAGQPTGSGETPGLAGQ